MAITALRDGDPIPTGTPARYTNGDGYVRLRWRVGPDEYVEAYEHRVVAGRPPGQHVHHVNGVRADNRAENLDVLDPETHGLLHEALAWSWPKFGPFRDHVRRGKAQRKWAREARWYAMRLAYESGDSLPEVGRLFGVHPTNVLRGLRGRGVPMRWWLAVG